MTNAEQASAEVARMLATLPKLTGRPGSAHYRRLHQQREQHFAEVVKLYAQLRLAKK